jgi:hypothetical protein
VLLNDKFSQDSFQKKTLAIADRFYFNQYFPIKDNQAVMELVRKSAKNFNGKREILDHLEK